MNPSALVVVTSNPTASPRPAEAVRIAAGLAPWQKFRVQLYLHQSVITALEDHPDAVHDFSVFRHYLPDLCQQTETVYGPEHGPSTLDVDGKELHVRPVSIPTLAHMAAASAWVLTF